MVTRRSTAEPRRKDRVAPCVCRSRKRAWRSLCDEDTRPSRHARQRCQLLSQATRQDSESQSHGPRDRRGYDSLCPRTSGLTRRGLFLWREFSRSEDGIADLSDARRPPERQRRDGAAVKRPMDRTLQDGMGEMATGLAAALIEQPQCGHSSESDYLPVLPRGAAIRGGSPCLPGTRITRDWRYEHRQNQEHQLGSAAVDPRPRGRHQEEPDGDGRESCVSPVIRQLLRAPRCPRSARTLRRLPFPSARVRPPSEAAESHRPENGCVGRAGCGSPHRRYRPR